MKSVFENYISKRNSIEVLKAIALAQLKPENHGKNIRLEMIQALTIKNLNSVKSSLNLDGLSAFLNENFESDYREDPPENLFTGNIQFHNGNNIVFPGIANDIIEMNQMLLFTLHINSEIEESVKTKIIEGSTFLLSIGNTIARELRINRNYFKSIDDQQIELPTESEFKLFNSIIEFSEEQILEICSSLNINKDVIQDFLFDYETDSIDIENLEEGNFLYKPFIKVYEIYYFILPSCQMLSLNRFINNLLDQEENSSTAKYYDVLARQENLKCFFQMGWDREKEIENKIKISPVESLWKIDDNKICYSYAVPNEKDGFLVLKEKLESNMKLIKKSYPSLEVLVLITHRAFSSKDGFFLISLIENAEYQIVCSGFDLKCLVGKWKISGLDLWKYAKAEKSAHDKDLMMPPLFSIITFYHWYQQNKSSFFHPDEKYGGISFDFEIQANIKREFIQENDERSGLYVTEEGDPLFIPLVKSKPYAPIYISDEIYTGNYLLMLDVFDISLWIKTRNKRSLFEKHLVDAIAYWLYEFSEIYLKGISEYIKGPLEIIVNGENQFDEITLNKINDTQSESLNFKYQVDKHLKKIEVFIPFEFYKSIDSDNNYGEQCLVDTVINSLFKLLQLIIPKAIIPERIRENIQFEMSKDPYAKMIVTADTSNNPALNNQWIPSPRYIQEYDKSLILEGIIEWFPQKIEINHEFDRKDDKVKFFVQCVNTLIIKIREKIREYNCIELIEYITPNHEALIQQNEHRKYYIPTKIACYSKYQDVKSEYSKSEIKIVSSSLASRCLIEFIVAEPCYGTKKPNQDDVDYLIALMDSIIYFGFLQDLIRFDIDNPNISILESGRIGIDQSFYSSILQPYAELNREDEITNYNNSFSEFYKSGDSKVNELAQENQTSYYDKVDLIFKEELGIELFQIVAFSMVLSEYCLSEEKSIIWVEEDKFLPLISSLTKGIDEFTIKSYVDLMVLNTRGKIGIPPDGFKAPDIFPWRYNRSLSYLNKPIIKIKNQKGEYVFLWSARFLKKSSDNLLANFHNGSLKLDKKSNKINELLSKRNNIKGREFREKVYSWLKTNTQLRVIPNEVKIGTRGQLIADKNYGDIDILAIDEQLGTVYSIECKNTNQAKTLYDFQRDLKNYKSKQIPKHVSREKWLINNINQVIEKFKIPSSNVSVKSIFVSSHQLPAKFFNEEDLKMYSFAEFQSKRLFG